MAPPWQTSALQKMAARLRRRGLNGAADRLLELGNRLKESREGASWLARNSAKVRAVLSRHVENAGTEWDETAHLLRVARQLLVERKAVVGADLELARTQFMDLLKTVPASAVFAGTFLIPIPGAQPILAPVLMERLGLLPSAWAESRIESELRDLVGEARQSGLDDIADELEQMLAGIRSHLSEVSRLRAYVQENPDWAIFFDEDLDSNVSDEELSHLRQRVNRAAQQAIEDPDAPNWTVYFRGDNHDDKIRQNLSFTQVRTGFPDGRNALIRRGDSDWWVPLWAVMELLG